MKKVIFYVTLFSLVSPGIQAKEMKNCQAKSNASLWARTNPPTIAKSSYTPTSKTSQQKSVRGTPYGAK